MKISSIILIHAYLKDVRTYKDADSRSKSVFIEYHTLRATWEEATPLRR